MSKKSKGSRLTFELRTRESTTLAADVEKKERWPAAFVKGRGRGRLGAAWLGTEMREFEAAAGEECKEEVEGSDGENRSRVLWTSPSSSKSSSSPVRE